MKFTLSVYILTGVVSALTLASTVINILILAEVGNFAIGNVAVSAVSLACSLILFALCMLLIFKSEYVFRDDELRVWFGMIFISFPYDKILAAVIEKMTKKLYVQYAVESKKRDYEILAINIDPAKNEAFLKELLDKNPNISKGDDDTPID